MTTAERIHQLADLLDQGLITRPEFDEQKRLVLGQPSPDGAPDQRVSTGEMRAMLTEGAMLGAYRLVERLGVGGMGWVWRARHMLDAVAERQGGDVAIKVMHPQLAADARFKARFQREAELGLTLRHPAIVATHDLIADGPTLALVMQLVEGASVGDLWGAGIGQARPEVALPLFRQILEGVAHAHVHGVLHRDIKPDNFIIDLDGRVHLLDFGIAKRMDEGSAGPTRAGARMGSTGYMAPEQFEDARSVDARADVYSLAVSFYEILAGRLPWPFEATETMVLTLKLTDRLEPLATVVPGLSDDLYALIDRGLTFEREDRFPDALEMLTVLAAMPGAGAPLHVPQEAITAAMEVAAAETARMSGETRSPVDSSASDTPGPSIHSLPTRPPSPAPRRKTVVMGDDDVVGAAAANPSAASVAPPSEQHRPPRRKTVVVDEGEQAEPAPPVPDRVLAGEAPPRERPGRRRRRRSATPLWLWGALAFALFLAVATLALAATLAWEVSRRSDERTPKTVPTAAPAEPAPQDIPMLEPKPSESQD